MRRVRVDDVIKSQFGYEQIRRIVNKQLTKRYYCHNSETYLRRNQFYLAYATFGGPFHDEPTAYPSEF